MSSILLIETEPSNKKRIEEFLRKEEFKVFTSKKKNPALDTIRRKHPAAVLIGKIPGVTAGELLAVIRAESEIYNTPVIVMAEKSEAGNKIKMLDTGADEFMTKPIDEKELLARLNNLIRRVKNIETKAFMDMHQPTVESAADLFMRDLIDFFADNLGNSSLSIDDLVDEFGMSKSTIQRKTKTYANKTFNQLLREFRLEQAKQILDQEGGTVGDVAFAVGFNSISYFSFTFKNYFGYSPKKISMRKRSGY